MNSQLRDYCRQACNASQRERNSAGFEVANRLYEAFKNYGVSYDSRPNGSQLLYASAGLILNNSTRSYTDSVYEFLKGAFAVNRTADQIFESINNNFNAYGRNLVDILGRMSDRDYTQFAHFAILLFSCDGYISSSEEAFIDKFMG